MTFTEPMIEEAYDVLHGGRIKPAEETTGILGYASEQQYLKSFSFTSQLYQISWRGHVCVYAYTQGHYKLGVW